VVGSEWRVWLRRRAWLSPSIHEFDFRIADLSTSTSAHRAFLDNFGPEKLRFQIARDLGTKKSRTIFSSDFRRSGDRIPQIPLSMVKPIEDHAPATQRIACSNQD
jgi:hypothetical protein